MSKGSVARCARTLPIGSTTRMRCCAPRSPRRARGCSEMEEVAGARPADRAARPPPLPLRARARASARPARHGTPAALISVDLKDLNAINDAPRPRRRRRGASPRRPAAAGPDPLERRRRPQRRRRVLAAARPSRRRTARSRPPSGSPAASPPIRSTSATPWCRLDADRSAVTGILARRHDRGSARRAARNPRTRRCPRRPKSGAFAQGDCPAALPAAPASGP